MGVSENQGYLILGVLVTRILLFRVLYLGPLFSETPIFSYEVRIRSKLGIRAAELK